MEKTNVPEVWLRGPVGDVPPLLQPVAHTLLQSLEEVKKYMNGFPEELLWEKPAGVASVGFHLMHLTGVVDRLFTYAQGEALSEVQFAWLSSEGKPGDPPYHAAGLISKFDVQVAKALIQLRNTNEQTLREPRAVGRAQLPSTVLGLLFHAAEHTQRHVGGLLVTAKVLLASKQ